MMRKDEYFFQNRGVLNEIKGLVRFDPPETVRKRYRVAFYTL